jgi:hypothetical protein
MEITNCISLQGHEDSLCVSLLETLFLLHHAMPPPVQTMKGYREGKSEINTYTQVCAFTLIAYVPFKYGKVGTWKDELPGPNGKYMLWPHVASGRQWHGASQLWSSDSQNVDYEHCVLPHFVPIIGGHELVGL